MDWRGTQTKLTGELRKRNGLASYANEKWTGELRKRNGLASYANEKTGEVRKQDKQQREDEKKIVT